MVSHIRRVVARYIVPGLLDALVVYGSLFLAWSGRSITATLDARVALQFGLLAVAVYWASNHVFGLYRRYWRYASADEVPAIAVSVATGTGALLALALLFFRSRHHVVPLSVVLFMGLFVLVGFTIVRYRERAWTAFQARWHPWHKGRSRGRSRILIVGAGEAGQLLAWRCLHQDAGNGYEVVGFVDSDPDKIGLTIHGFPVLGYYGAIPRLVVRHQVDLIIIAPDEMPGDTFRDLLAICEGTSACVKVLPDIFDFIQRTKGLPPLRDISIEDLLGREPVKVDHEACSGLLQGKSVLVTGAAGSIGSELCRQVLAFHPRRLTMLDNNESGLYNLHLELEPLSGGATLQIVVGDVVNRQKIDRLFAELRPEIVFHAAAYKHVPLMEEHPDEAVRVNVLGTRNVAEAACRCGAERLVFISTDKAVNPTSTMGATKRVGEMLISALAGTSSTLCTAVRFGNVLGSRGSVVPTFERQIEKGGPVTVTHPDMTRYFMSIQEAVALVIYAASLTRGGDIFVLDMGEQVRIEELAQRLIRLRGLRPGVDIPIRYIGVRSGEKLHESLVEDDGDSQPTEHPSIRRVNSNHEWRRADLYRQIDNLARALEEDRQAAAEALWKIACGAPRALPRS